MSSTCHFSYLLKLFSFLANFQLSNNKLSIAMRFFVKSSNPNQFSMRRFANTFLSRVWSSVWMPKGESFPYLRFWYKETHKIAIDIKTYDRVFPEVIVKPKTLLSFILNFVKFISGLCLDGAITMLVAVLVITTLFFFTI